MFPAQRPGAMRPPVALPQPTGTSEAMPRSAHGTMGPTTRKGAPSPDLKRMAILAHLKGGK